MACKRGHADGDRRCDNVNQPRPAVEDWDDDVGWLLRSRAEGAEHFGPRGPLDSSPLLQASSHRLEEPRRRSLGQLDLDLTEAVATPVASGCDHIVVAGLGHGTAG